jgi:hypothetical protein
VQTKVSHYDDIDRELINRNYERAVSEIVEARKKGNYEEKDRVLYYLDLGIALHNAGQYDKSNDYLSEAEIAIEENFTKSISKLLTSMILNDNVLDYSGEDFEDIFMNVLMALNYMHLNNIDDTMVEIRRIDIKLSKLQDKYEGMAKKLSNTEENIKFKAGHTDLRYSALGSFLSMVSYLHQGKYDDARIDRQRVEVATPAKMKNFLDDVFKVPSEGKVSLYPVCFVGKSPVKIPLELGLDLNPDLNLGRIIIPGEEKSTLFFEYKGEEDLHFKFAVPKIEERESKIYKIRVLVNGSFMEEMHYLENFGNVAIKAFEVKKPIIYLRSGVRTFLKAILDKKATDEIDEKTEDKKVLGAVLKFLVDVAADITESADLRCWRTMPGHSYVGLIELHPGTYNITFEYFNSRGKVIDRETKKGVEIKEGKINIIEGVSYL